MNPGYDFYIFEGNKNCYEGKEYAVFLCRMAEASYIMQPKKKLPGIKDSKLPALVNKID